MKKLIIVLCFLPFLLPAQEYGLRVRVQPTAGFVGGSVQDFAAWIGGAFVPITFTDTVSVNTAGQVLRIRKAGKDWFVDFRAHDGYFQKPVTAKGTPIRPIGVYFGGNRPAPQDIEILINKTIIK